MKALWTPIDGCFQAHSRIMMTVMMQQPQFYIQLVYNIKPLSLLHFTIQTFISIIEAAKLP